MKARAPRIKKTATATHWACERRLGGWRAFVLLGLWSAFASCPQGTAPVEKRAGSSERDSQEGFSSRGVRRGPDVCTQEGTEPLDSVPLLSPTQRTS